VKSHTSVLGLFLRSHQDTAEAESIPSSDHSAAVSDTPSPCHKTVQHHNIRWNNCTGNILKSTQLTRVN